MYLVNFNTNDFDGAGSFYTYTIILTKRKVGFLVIDLTWKIFCQTGNIEAYLLLKELEIEMSSEHAVLHQDTSKTESVDMHMQ